jgi:hypothetical protein
MTSATAAGAASVWAPSPRPRARAGRELPGRGGRDVAHRRVGGGRSVPTEHLHAGPTRRALGRLGMVARSRAGRRLELQRAERGIRSVDDRREHHHRAAAHPPLGWCLVVGRPLARRREWRAGTLRDHGDLGERRLGRWTAARLDADRALGRRQVVDRAERDGRRRALGRRRHFELRRVGRGDRVEANPGRAVGRLGVERRAQPERLEARQRADRRGGVRLRRRLGGRLLCERGRRPVPHDHGTLGRHVVDAGRESQPEP